VEIKKAVITAAGVDQQSLPLQTFVDRDGVTKSALRILVEETLAAGVESVAVVIRPGAETAFRLAAGEHANRLHFVIQAEPRGYGHAVAQARQFTGNEPFLLLVSDHLYVSRETRSCAQQLVGVAAAENCAVSAVQATHERKLPYYGVVGGTREPRGTGLYKVETVVEKPTPTVAEQELVVPGLRAGHYLCFFGMHVLTAAVMDFLEGQVSRSPHVRVPLSPALAMLALRERYLAFEVHGRRHDIGVKYGLFMAQLALALEGERRDEVLSQMIELIAGRVR